MLVLSRFAGAARQLGSALIVNPHDADELADALDRALRMSLSERQERWQACWRAIDNATPVQWGRTFLATLLRVGSGTPANTLSIPALPTIRPKSLAIQG